MVHSGFLAADHGPDEHLLLSRAIPKFASALAARGPAHIQHMSSTCPAHDRARRPRACQQGRPNVISPRRAQRAPRGATGGASRPAQEVLEMSLRRALVAGTAGPPMSAQCWWAAVSGCSAGRLVHLGLRYSL